VYDDVEEDETKVRYDRTFVEVKCWWLMVGGRWNEECRKHASQSYSITNA
jgi:hypothetical protein